MDPKTIPPAVFKNGREVIYWDLLMPILHSISEMSERQWFFFAWKCSHKMYSERRLMNYSNTYLYSYCKSTIYFKWRFSFNHHCKNVVTTNSPCKIYKTSNYSSVVEWSYVYVWNQEGNMKLIKTMPFCWPISEISHSFSVSLSDS